VPGKPGTYGASQSASAAASNGQSSSRPAASRNTGTRTP